MSFYINIVLDIINISIYYIYYSNQIIDLLNYKSNDNNPKFIKDYSFFKDLIDTLLILYPNIVIQTFTVNDCFNIEDNTIKSNIISSSINVESNNNIDTDGNQDKANESSDNKNDSDNNFTHIEDENNDINENNIINNSNDRNNQFLNLKVHFYYENTPEEKESGLNKKKRKEIIFKIKYNFVWQSIHNIDLTMKELNNFYDDLKLFYFFCFIFNSDMFNQVLSLNHQKYDKKTTKLFIDKLIVNYFYLIKNYSNYQGIENSENNNRDTSLFDSNYMDDIYLYQPNVVSFNELFSDIKDEYDHKNSKFKSSPLINIPEKSIINITNMLIKWMDYFESRNKINKKRTDDEKESGNSDININSDFDWNTDKKINNKDNKNNINLDSNTNIDIKEIKQLLKPYKINFEILKIYTFNNIDFIKKLIIWNNNISNHNIENRNSMNKFDLKIDKNPDEKIINDSFYNIDIANLKSGLMKLN
ncbi:hypothetical protein PIROE2DRAFT_59451 [Piromyces sp. E2]|nr:hypothetical protein PIROE2DRAFT_59451 [Piromyces sp. E2]|eukprot:OUM66350.1 hypothetical protein PIROE2DRAFT_59451 [Piromyces sp. E2]